MRSIAITSVRRALSHARYYYLVFAAAFGLVLALAWYVAGHGLQLKPLEVRDYGLRACVFEGAAAGQPLRILDAVYIEALPLMDTLCASAELAQRFAAVELRSVHRDHIDLRDLYDSTYQLVLAKPELLEGGVREHQGRADYVQIARYPDYGSQFISLDGIPRLTRAWMSGKILGLLDDPNSVSAYKIPKAALRNSGLSDVPNIRYFRSYRQMYRAFFAGEVDVIPALLSDEGTASSLQLPEGLVLEETLPGPAWYLERAAADGPARCAVQAALVTLAAGSPLDFFRQLSIVEPCDDR
jgi:hypothetical protein